MKGTSRVLRFVPVTALALPIAACAPLHERTPAIVPAQDVVAFHGDLTNDGGGWSGVIFGDRVIYSNPGASGWSQQTVKRQERTGDARRLHADGLEIVISAGACPDASARDGVRLRLPEQSYDGCGGPRSLSRGIAGTTWTLRELAGRRAPDSRNVPATVTFVVDRSVAGSDGCNSVGSGMVSWREASTFDSDSGRFDYLGQSAIMTTALCRDRAGAEFGSRFWQRMATARTWRRDGARLTIIFADGAEAGLALIL